MGYKTTRAPFPQRRRSRLSTRFQKQGCRLLKPQASVNPEAVPELADADEVMKRIRRRPGVRYPVLIPNERGFDRALEAGVDAIALFASATERCQATFRCSIDESFERFAPVVKRALESDMWVRGYVSVAFDCPYSGPVNPEAVVKVTSGELFDLGCHEVSIADTLGTATQTGVLNVIHAVSTASISA